MLSPEICNNRVKMLSLKWLQILKTRSTECVGRDSSVGIKTHYGPNGPGIESRWGEIFRTHPDRTCGPPCLLYTGYPVIPEGQTVGLWLWPPTPTSAEVKERVDLYISCPLGLRGLFWGELHPYIIAEIVHLYSHCLNCKQTSTAEIHLRFQGCPFVFCGCIDHHQGMHTVCWIPPWS